MKPRALSAAEPHLNRALIIRRAQLGFDNPETGKSLLTLASLHLDIGRHDMAEIESDQAFDIFRNSLGEDHWLAGAALSVFGGALAGQEQYRSAEQSLVKAYETLTNSSGAAPVFIDATIERLEDVYSALGEPERATAYTNSLNSAN